METIKITLNSDDTLNFGLWSQLVPLIDELKKTGAVIDLEVSTTPKLVTKLGEVATRLGLNHHINRG